MTSPGSPAARETARRLLERETAGLTDAAARGAALERACARVSRNLRRSVGDDGYGALLTRALASTQSEQPVLKVIRRDDGAALQLDVAAGVASHGADAVAAALEALLAAIVEILSELIGADMVQNLLDHDEPPRAARDGRQS